MCLFLYFLQTSPSKHVGTIKKNFKFSRKLSFDIDKKQSSPIKLVGGKHFHFIHDSNKMTNNRGGCGSYPFCVSLLCPLTPFKWWFISITNLASLIPLCTHLHAYACTHKFTCTRARQQSEKKHFLWTTSILWFMNKKKKKCICVCVLVTLFFFRADTHSFAFSFMCGGQVCGCYFFFFLIILSFFLIHKLL